MLTIQRQTPTDAVRLRAIVREASAAADTSTPATIQRWARGNPTCPSCKERSWPGFGRFSRSFYCTRYDNWLSHADFTSVSVDI